MKIRFSILFITVLVLYFSINQSHAQQLQLVKVIDTLIQIKTTNTTGNDKWFDLSKAPLQNSLTVPKGKIWVINAYQAQVPYGSRSLDFYEQNNNSSSRDRGNYGQVLYDGGSVFNFNSFNGRLTLNGGTKIGIGIYSDDLTRYKWYRHGSWMASSVTWWQGFFSITEYEIVP